MSGVLFPQTPRATNRKNAAGVALANRLLGKKATADAFSGHKCWHRPPEQLPVEGKSTFGGFVVNARIQQKDQLPPQNEDSPGHHSRLSSLKWEGVVGRGLPIAVVSSTRNVHTQIPGLQDAAIGTCALAVVSTSHCNHAAEISHIPSPSEQGKTLAFRAYTRDLRFTNIPGQGSTVSPQLCAIPDCMSSGTGAVFSNTRRVFWGYWHRRGDSPGSRLGIYCKFPGAVVECPLDGPTFNLQECTGRGGVDDAVAPDGVHGAQLCWKLSRKGFNLLRDVDSYVIPGISALARDMASDSNCIEFEIASTETLVSRLAVEGRPYVVVPHFTGIYFCSSLINSPKRVKLRVTVARFEGIGRNGIQRLSLEDFGSAQLATPQVCDSKKSWPIPPGRKRRRYVALPVTYATLLEEARGRNTTAPGKVKGVVWKEWKWRRYSRYKPSPQRILPGLGDDIEGLEDYPPDDEIHLEKNLGDEPQEALVANAVVLGTQNTQNVDTSLVGQTSEGKRNTSGPSSSIPAFNENTSGGEGILDSASGETGQCDIPTLRAVDSTCPGLARRLASTKKIVRVLLARSCQSGCETVHEHSLEGITREGLGENRCCEARRTACALLAKAVEEEDSLEVLGDIGYNKRNRQDHQGSCGTQKSNMLDEWYEGFWLEVGQCQGDPYRVLHEAPRLLLGEMLEIQEVRVGFLQRGLLRRLTAALNRAVEESWLGFDSSCADAEAVSPTKVTKLKQTSFDKDGTMSVGGCASCPYAEHGGTVRFQRLGARERQAGVDNSPASRMGAVPRREGYRHSAVSGLVSPRVAVPWWLFVPGSESLTSSNEDCIDWEPESEDVGVSADADGSSQTASVGGFTAAESGHTTSREDQLAEDYFDPKAVNFEKTAAGIGEAIDLQTEMNENGDDTNTKERAIPPLLRLDVLQNGRGSQEWSSPSSSRHATVTLSAASTRAPAHLPSFRSARGATSRGSARHHSGRDGGSGSIRTGRNTQRSSARTGSPPAATTERENPRVGAPPLQPCNDGTSKVEVGSAVSIQYCDGNVNSKVEMGLTSTTGDTPLPPYVRQSSEGEGDPNHSVHPAARRNDANISRGGGTSSCGGKQPVPLLSLACLPTHVPTMMTRSKQSVVYHVDRVGFISAEEREGDPSATRLVVSLACATTPIWRLERLFKGDAFAQIIATAKLVLSLLPMEFTADTNDGDLEAGLVAALRALSCAGSLSWIGAFSASGLAASGSHESGMPTVSSQVDISKPKPSADAMDAEGRMGAEKSKKAMGAECFVSSEEFDSVGVTFLLRCTSVCIRFRYRRGPSVDVSSERSHESGDNPSSQETRVRSCPHRELVSTISRVALERTWLIRLLLRGVSGGLRLDKNLWSSSLSTHVIFEVVAFCDEFIKRLLLDSCIHKSDLLGRTDDSAHCKREGCFELQHRVWTKESGAALLLAAPVVINLTALLISVLRLSTAWGEDLASAAATCRSMARSDAGEVGLLSVLVHSLNGLTAFILTVVDSSDCHDTVCAGKMTITEWGDGTRAGSEDGQSYREASNETRDLVRMTDGGVAAIVELLTQVLESVRAVLCRSATLLNTSRGNGPFPTYNVGSPNASCKSSTSIIGGISKIPTEHGTDGSVQKGKLQTPEGEQDESVSKKTLHSVAEETVSQVLTEVSPLFQPGGCVFALLDPQFVSTAALRDCHHECSPVGEQTTSIAITGTTAAKAALTSNICLVADFFSLCSECDFSIEGLRLERYVKPLFFAFVKYLGRAGDTDPDGDDDVQKVGSKKRQLPSEREPLDRSPDVTDDDDVLMCRLYLSALVRLAAIPDPTIRQAMHELHVAQWLLCEVLQPAVTADMASSPAIVEESAKGSLSEGAKNMDQVCEPGGSISATAGLSSSHSSSLVGIVPTGIVESTTGDGEGHHGTSEVMGRGVSLGGDIQPMYAPGDKIDGLFTVRSSGRPRWFPGRVVDINKDGTVNVCYDDGDEENHKDRESVRPQRRRAHAPRSGIITCKARSLREEPSVTLQADSARKAITDRFCRTEERLSNLVSDSSEQRVGHWPQGDLVETFDNHETHGRTTLRGSRSSGVIRPTDVQDILDPNENGSAAQTAFNHGSEKEDEYVDRQSGGVEDDEEGMYFVIPSVIGTSTSISTRLQSRTSPTLAVPLIDLQSSHFGTSKLRSSQLGPGCSLSTPTTGGGGDRFRGPRGPRSEGALAAIFANGSILPTRQSSLVIDRSSTRSPLGSPQPSPTGILRGPILPSLSGYDSAIDRMGTQAVPFGDNGASASSDPRREQRRGLSDRSEGNSQLGKRCEFQGTAPEVTGALAAALQFLAISDGSGIDGRQASGSDRRLPAPTLYNDAIEIREGLVTLLLHLMSMAGDVSGDAVGIRNLSKSTGMELDPLGEEEDVYDLEANGMFILQNFFDDPQNALLIPGLSTQWREGSVARTAIEKSAIFAKLSCSSLFDDSSYSLSGHHIEGGSFGDVLVSRSPLPLQTSLPLRMGGRSHKVQNNTGTPTELLRDQEVALKVVERDAFDHSIGPNVYREVLALRTLSGVAGICELHDFGLTPTSYVLVMDRCICSLKKWMSERRGTSGDDGMRETATVLAPSSDEEVVLHLLIFRQIASAVAGMAERGVIHFDLKCDNVLVRGSACCVLMNVGSFNLGDKLKNMKAPSVCVADFGEAIVGRRKPSFSTWQRPSQGSGGLESDCHRQFEFNVQRSRGTERIQSPEMLVWASGGCGSSGNHLGTGDSVNGRGRTSRTRLGLDVTITTAADVWSLGCLLYEVLSGRFLFEFLLWSEFFVTLTAGETSRTGGMHGEGETSEKRDEKLRGERENRADEIDVAQAQPNTMLPPLSSMQPFAALGSAETLRKLMESMLVRDPCRRPSASSVVAATDTALVRIIEMIPEVVRNRFTSSGSDWPDWISPTMAQEAGQTEVPDPREGEILARPKATTAVGTGVPYTKQQDVQDLPVDMNNLDWPIKPCEAVRAFRRMALKQVCVLDCEGYVSRLGAGAFLLSLNAPARCAHGTVGEFAEANGGDNENCTNTERGNHGQHVQMQPTESYLIGPSTNVCVTGNKWAWRCEGIEGKVALESLIPAVGVTHVVCVTTGLDQSGEERGWYDSHISETACGLRTGKRSRLMNVYLPDNWGDHKGTTDANCSLQAVMRKVERDVLSFAIGPRVLFVGLDGDGGAAGAVAMTWAMGRTGKGSFETMLDFRQSCDGFWVEPLWLRAVVSHGEYHHLREKNAQHVLG